MTQKGASKGEMGEKGTEKSGAKKAGVEAPAGRRENPFETAKRDDHALWKKPLDSSSELVRALAERKEKGKLKLEPVEGRPNVFETKVGNVDLHLIVCYDGLTGPGYEVYEGKAQRIAPTEKAPLADWTGGTT